MFLLAIVLLLAALLGLQILSSHVDIARLYVPGPHGVDIARLYVPGPHSVDVARLYVPGPHSLASV